MEKMKEEKTKKKKMKNSKKKNNFQFRKTIKEK